MFKRPKEHFLMDMLEQLNFVVDKDNSDIVKIFADYFEEEQQYRTKGLFLYSGPGTGKSCLFKSVSRFVWWKTEFNKFETIHARELAHNFGKHGFEAFDIYPNIDILIDDVGSEPIFKYFGSDIIPLAEFIDLRYEKYPGLKTHFTSNFAPSQLEKRYGVRILSRLKEMCNFHFMKGVDRRG